MAKAPADSLSLEAIVTRASSINSVTSLLIQKDGKLLAEHYLGRLNKNETTNIKSASKSIISLLVGIAINRGDIESVDEPIAQYFEEYFKENPNPEKEKITIKDLLTMRSGLETTSFHNYGRWVVSENWVKFALEQPMEAKPGGDMVYSTGTSHLLSVILTKATGMSTKAFAEKHLFEPLNIQVGGWDRDPQGYYMGGNNMALRPADMLKLGQMVLSGGTYKGQRIVPEQWLNDSFQTYTRSNYNPYDYGYMWWEKPVGQFKVHFAWGYGGQYIFIVPSLDAVIVLTGNLQNASQSRSYKDPVFDLLREEVLPFLES
ncbi:MAG: serine hydrolase [Balneolaceae bacterium]|nr:serine hydrolase [Balneolaceae bacterium]